MLAEIAAGAAPRRGLPPGDACTAHGVAGRALVLPSGAGATFEVIGSRASVGHHLAEAASGFKVAFALLLGWLVLASGATFAGVLVLRVLVLPSGAVATRAVVGRRANVSHPRAVAARGVCGAGARGGAAVVASGATQTFALPR